jgi:uncharacterized protein (TIGR03083 family)
MHQDLVAAVEERRTLARAFEELVTSLGPDKLARPTENPGWSCKDLVAHLASGDWVMQQVVQAALAGKDLSGGLPGIDVEGGNEERIAAARAHTVEEVLAGLHTQRAETERLWEQLTDQHLATTLPPWTGGSLRTFLQGFSGHDRYHIGQFHAALQK